MCGFTIAFWWKKTQWKLSNGLKSATGTRLHQKQPFVGGMLSLNVVVKDTEDAERSGRPNEVVTSETIKKVHQIVFENRKLKLRKIADTLKISYGSVYAILHEHLSMRKLLSKWVPRLLTVDQKRQRFVDSKRCLKLFHRNKPNFLRRYVTMDETWIHHYTS